MLSDLSGLYFKSIFGVKLLINLEFTFLSGINVLNDNDE